MSTPTAEPPRTIYRESGLVVVLVLTIIYLGIVVAIPGSPVQEPFGFIELLFAPGYALGAMVFLRRPLLPPAAEVATTVGLSVIFNVLIGLIFVLEGFGLAIFPLALADLAITFVGLFVVLAWGRSSGSTGISQAVLRELRLPSVRPSYRPAIYALLVATVVAFGAVVVVGLSQPSTPPPTSIAMYGASGTTSSVPTDLTVGEVGLVFVEVQDGYSAGSLELSAVATLVGGQANATSIPWTLPLVFYPGTESTLPLSVSYGGQTTVNVTFEFPQPGNYTLTFSIAPAAGGASLLGTEVGLVIRPS